MGKSQSRSRTRQELDPVSSYQQYYGSNMWLTSSEHWLPIEFQRMNIWNLRSNGVLSILRRVHHTNSKEKDRKRKLSGQSYSNEIRLKWLTTMPSPKQTLQTPSDGFS
jgi:hypothetical protein